MRAGDARDHAADDAFDVRHVAQAVTQLLAPQAVVEEALHTVEALVDLHNVHERLSQPAGQQAGAHGRPGLI